MIKQSWNDASLPVVKYTVQTVPLTEVPSNYLGGSRIFLRWKIKFAMVEFKYEKANIQKKKIFQNIFFTLKS